MDLWHTFFFFIQENSFTFKNLLYFTKIFFTSQKSSDDLQYKYQQEDQGAEAQQNKQKQLNL